MKWIIDKTQKDIDPIEWIKQKRESKNSINFKPIEISDIHSSALLHDIEKAAKEIEKAIKENKKIFIHGDFDVDGVTATSIMWDFLYRHANANILPYIPNRFDEGYGLSESSIQSIIDQGGDLIITVDCGVKDIELVEKYKDQIDFVITDHHTILSTSEAKDSLDNKSAKKSGNFAISNYAKAVVHPMLGSYPFHEICGAVVSFKVCEAINKQMNVDIDMSKYLGLACMGTICDVMPLINENRAIVHFGLEILRSSQNQGLEALSSIANFKLSEIEPYHIGFIIGPRINAAGRLDSALDAVRLLTTHSNTQAQELATKLDKLNKERQTITTSLLQTAQEQIAKQADQKVFVLYGEKWPEGIIGLIAGRICQEYNRPVLVASVDGDKAKGSARSIEAFNIANTLKQLNHLLIRHGGHAQAAGFQLKTENMDEFIREIQAIASNEITEKDMEPILNIDATGNYETLSVEQFEKLSLLSPFGNKNEEPIFAFLNVQIIDKFFMGKEKRHVKLAFDINSEIHYGINFNSNDHIRNIEIGQTIDIAGTLNKNSWNNKSEIQVMIKDIRVKS